MTTILDKIESKQKEAFRLIQTLRYYQWLEINGIHYGDIKGVAALPVNRAADWYKKTITRHSFLLTDGRKVELTNIPFAHEVIFNKSFVVQETV